MESQKVSKNHQSIYLEQERLVDELMEALKTHPRFILVFHEWWIDSLGFKVKPVDSNTYDEAFVEGLRIKNDHESKNNMRKTAFTVIEIGSNEVVGKPVGQRLTLWERLTGYVNQ